MVTRARESDMKTSLLWYLAVLAIFIWSYQLRETYNYIPIARIEEYLCRKKEQA